MLLAFDVSAQKQIEKKDLTDAPAYYQGSYITDSRLDKFVGLWKWEEGNEVFQLSLEKIKKFDLQKDYKQNLLMDIIQGKYFFNEDQNKPNPVFDDYLFIDFGTTRAEYALGFVLRDELNDWVYSGTMEIDPDNPNKAYFRFEPMEKMTIVHKDQPIAKKERGVKIPGGLLKLEGKPLIRIDK